MAAALIIEVRDARIGAVALVLVVRESVEGLLIRLVSPLIARADVVRAVFPSDELKDARVVGALVVADDLVSSSLARDSST